MSFNSHFQSMGSDTITHTFELNLHLTKLICKWPCIVAFFFQINNIKIFFHFFVVRALTTRTVGRVLFCVLLPDVWCTPDTHLVCTDYISLMVCLFSMSPVHKHALILKLITEVDLFGET